MGSAFQVAIFHIHAGVFMTNQPQLLMTPTEESAIFAGNAVSGQVLRALLQFTAGAPAHGMQADSNPLWSRPEYSL
jgi:hypothetical protein